MIKIDICMNNEIDLVKNRVGRPVKYTYEYTYPIVQKWFELAKKATFQKVLFDPKSGEQKTIELNKPFTIQHFCLNTGIDFKTFQAIINSNPEDMDCIYDKELIQLFTHVQDIIRDNQISGAILNEYNANIVSRINGLNDTIDIQQNVSINSLPVHINNNIIDLTSAEYTVLNDNSANKLIELTENTLTE